VRSKALELYARGSPTACARGSSSWTPSTKVWPRGRTGSAAEAVLIDETTPPNPSPLLVCRSYETSSGRARARGTDKGTFREGSCQRFLGRRADSAIPITVRVETATCTSGIREGHGLEFVP
jgi:hypothetical protein